jgi:hypothetical protein
MAVSPLGTTATLADVRHRSARTDSIQRARIVPQLSE